MSLTLLVASLLLQGVAPASAQLPISKQQVHAAAKRCGTKAKTVDLPDGLLPLVKSTFGISLDPHATAAQPDCFYALVPTAKVGLISEPPSVEKN